MSEHRKYARDPITEAVIEIRIAYEGERSLTDLEPMTPELAEWYPKPGVINLGSGQMTFGTQVGATAKSQQIGYLYSGDDGRNLLQARIDSFALSRLSPYTSWQNFRQDARALFDIYKHAIRPEKIVRVATRYINKFDLPGPVLELRDYFATYPEPPSDQTMAGFYMQVTLDHKEIEARSIINMTGIGPTSPEVISVILDIDVFREGEFEVGDGIWDLLDSLREREYLLFEQSITDRARKLID